MESHGDRSGSETSLMAGKIFELQDKKQLDTFETELVATQLPSAFNDPLERWATRQSISELVVPPKFLGKVTNIVAVVMENPLEELEARGHKLLSSIKDKDTVQQNIVGFHVLADMVSTGRGVIGSFDTRIWIWRRDSKESNRSHYGEYHRFIDTPKKAMEDVERLIQTSSAIGLRLLKYSIRHPYLGGFETRRFRK